MKNSLQTNEVQRISRLQKRFMSLSTAVVLVAYGYAILNDHATLALGEVITLMLLYIGIIYSNAASYPYLHRYLDFTISQIPNILQNLTFAGFVAIGFRHQTGALLAIIALTLTINNLYLNNRQAAYIKELATDLNKQRMSVKFLLFNHLFVIFLFFVLYPLAGALLQ